MTIRRAFFAAAAFGIAALPAPASAFYCYVPEKPGGPVPLRERPNEKAKIIVLMPPGGMVRLIPSRQPEGWVQVRWQKEAQSRRFDARGWARRDDVHGGECAD